MLEVNARAKKKEKKKGKGEKNDISSLASAGNWNVLSLHSEGNLSKRVSELEQDVAEEDTPGILSLRTHQAEHIPL